MTDISASQKKAGLTKLELRLFQGILPFDRSRVLADIIAGLTLAAVGIPEVGSGANFIKCVYLSGEKLCRFKRPGPRSKFPERWLLVRLMV